MNSVLAALIPGFIVDNLNIVNHHHLRPDLIQSFLNLEYFYRLYSSGLACKSYIKLR